MHVLASRLILPLTVALEGDRSLSLTELAQVVEASLSSVQSALRSMAADDIVLASGSRKARRYRLRTARATDALRSLAESALPPERRLPIVARSHGAIEFLARQAEELIVVFAAGADALEESRAAAALEKIAGAAGMAVRYLYHDDVRRELLADPALRERMAVAEILHGELDRSFPDRRGHGVGSGQPLGRPNEALRVPSRRLLRRLAQEHGIAQIRLFGSAARSDLRPDSDIDLAVRYRPGARPGVGERLALERELERALGRDVDVVDEGLLAPELRAALDQEAVALL